MVRTLISAARGDFSGPGSIKFEKECVGSAGNFHAGRYHFRTIFTHTVRRLICSLRTGSRRAPFFTEHDAVHFERALGQIAAMQRACASTFMCLTAYDECYMSRAAGCS
jgi:hypothetical protein